MKEESFMVGQWQDLGSVNIWDGSIISQLSLLLAGSPQAGAGPDLALAASFGDWSPESPSCLPAGGLPWGSAS